MADQIRNEHIKLFCNWCNTIAAAMITVGVFTPLAVRLYGIGEEHGGTDLTTGLSGFASLPPSPYIYWRSGISKHWTIPMTGSDLAILGMPIIAAVAVAFTGLIVVYAATHRKAKPESHPGSVPADLTVLRGKGLFPVVLMNKQQLDAYRSILVDMPHAAE